MSLRLKPLGQTGLLGQLPSSFAGRHFESTLPHFKYFLALTLFSSTRAAKTKVNFIASRSPHPTEEKNTSKTKTISLEVSGGSVLTQVGDIFLRLKTKQKKRIERMRLKRAGDDDDKE